MERCMDEEARCLRGLGLDENLTERFVNSHCAPERLCILTKFRASLLEKLHADQRRLECLDCLIYELRKKN